MKYLVFALLCICAVCAVYYVPPIKPDFTSRSFNADGKPTQVPDPTPREIEEAVAAKKFEGSPLEVAILSGQNNRIIAFIKAGAPLDMTKLKAKFSDGFFFLPYLNKDALELLIDKGLDLRVPVIGSKILNMYVSDAKDGDIIHMLVRRGANPNDGIFPGQPLRHAIYKANLVALKALLEEKADPNAIDHMGNTPLHAAVEKNNLEMIKLLLKAGADPQKRNRKGQRPLDVAGDIRSLLRAKEGKK